MLATPAEPKPVLPEKRSVVVALSHLRLDKESGSTLRRSLCACIRTAIVQGGLKPGARLPSTRLLALELAISRNTVTDAFAELVAEGYLVSHRGSGTFVAAAIRVISRAKTRTAWERASSRGNLLAARSSEDSLQGRSSLPFEPGIPAYEHFPFDVWSRIAARILRRPKPEILGYGHSAGYAPLREVVAAELRARGAAACRDEQIVIVGGTAQALDIVARLTLDPGDEVWLEDPSSLYARATLAGSGAHLVPVPVDDEGLDVRAGIARSPRARLAHVTSAHQWPLRATLSNQRREELLQWANDADAWIIEDEYDGIFRYDGTRPQPLHAMDRSERVIGIGSFSVTTFPAIRLGYIVAPASLINAFVAAKALVDRQASIFEQAILADFVHDGHYRKHRTTMEAVYAGRQRALIGKIAELGGPVVAPAGSGLHVILPLDPFVDDRAVSRAAQRAGISAPPLSVRYLTGRPRKGLILGFGAGTSAAMEWAAAKLCTEVLCPPHARRMTRLGLDVPG